MTLLSDVDFLASTEAATARARLLTPRLISSPGVDASVALHCIGAFDHYLSEELLTSLEEEKVAAPLSAAARTLVSIVDYLRHEKRQLDDADEALLLHAAIAFAMHGNFPCARVAMLSSTETCRTNTAARRFAWAICDPASIESIIEFADGETEEVWFYRSWIDALRDCSEAPLAKAAKLLKRFTVSPDVSDTALLMSAEVGFRQAFRLSVGRLGSTDTELPRDFVGRLIESGRWTLLPPQRELLKDLRIAGTKQNALLNLPTSTGKTLVAEACLASAMREPGITVFVAPYVAIGEQVLIALKSHMPENVEIIAMFGGFKSEYPESDPHARQVLVATPERFDGWLRSTGNRDMLRTVILDELHIIENGSRGARLEGIVSRLRLLQQDSRRLRVVSLSAVLRQADTLLDWLAVPIESFYRGGWRPTARRLAICRSDGMIVWIHGADSLRPENAKFGTEIGRTKISLPERIEPFYGRFVPDRDSVAESRNIATIAVYLSKRLRGAGLIVCPRRVDTRRVADALASLVQVPEKRDVLESRAQLIEMRWPWLSGLAANVRRGVAYHNATLPFETRKIVEDGIREGTISYVASTTTLAEGADLPFRWTLISHWLRGVYDGAEPINPLIFRNIAGRSGRAGSYTEGDTIIYESLLGTRGTVSSDPQRRLNSIAKVLIDSSPLQSAVRLATDSAASEEAAAIKAAFASQVLAAIPENAAVEDIDVKLAEASYAVRSGHSEEISSVFSDALTNLLDPNQLGGPMAMRHSPVQLTPLGQAANLSGFSPDTVRRMLTFLQHDALPDEPAKIIADVLEHLFDVPEQSSFYLRKLVGQPRHTQFTKKEDLPAVCSAWLAGADPREIFEQLPHYKATKSSAETIEDQYEKFVGFVDGALRSFAPWSIRALNTLKSFGSDHAKRYMWESLLHKLELREHYDRNVVH